MKTLERLLQLILFGSFAILASKARADILYVATETRDINKMTSDGTVSVFATLPAGSVYGDGLVFDSSGNLFVSDPNKGQIHKITPAGTVSLFKTLPVGSGPTGLAIDASDNLYVHTTAHELSKISPAGTLSHYATLPGSAEGLAFDFIGNLYVADAGGNQIHKINPSGVVSLFASLPTDSLPFGLAFDDIGNLYETGLDNLVRKITPGGAVSLFATLPNSVDPEAVGLAFDQMGNLYAAGLSGEISKITMAGTVSHFATATSRGLHIAVTDDVGQPLALPPITLYGDYNRNGTVDAADYVVWRKGAGSVYNAADYHICRAHFGEARDGSGTAGGLTGSGVPEPSTVGLVLCGYSLVSAMRSTRRRIN